MAFERHLLRLSFYRIQTTQLSLSSFKVYDFLSKIQFKNITIFPCSNKSMVRRRNTCTHTYTHEYIHAYTNTYIHTYIHTYTAQCSLHHKHTKYKDEDKNILDQMFGGVRSILYPLHLLTHVLRIK